MKRALLSVFDKTGIKEFALGLYQLGWEIISTGGTAKMLKDNNIPVTEISDVTRFPECFDGRVKTLHPLIHGGILAIRDNDKHIESMNELKINPIDIVVCNLYPFRETILKPNVSHEEIIENIDIGGPTMLRAAAKNYKFVSVIVDPADYEPVLNELSMRNTVSMITKEYLAAKVFQHTSNYDSLITSYLNKFTYQFTPDLLTLTYQKKQSLRYGENPHQKAAFYVEQTGTKGCIGDATQLHGKELSFNNINDANGALETIKEFDKPTVVAVKHANPCGIGTAETIFDAYKKAYECDPLAIFGGVVAFNREIDEQTAVEMNKIFLEVIIAPSYSEKALEILNQKKNIRTLQLTDIDYRQFSSFNHKKVLGGLLIQENDSLLFEEEIKFVTNAKPTPEQMENLVFAWKAVKHVKSNAIVLASNNSTIGIGAGQVSRIGALEHAIQQAGEKAEGSVLASDAYFPFSDSVEAAAKAGIVAIIQPGGSVKDSDSIDACNKYGIAMIFTGIRHFKH